MSVRNGAARTGGEFSDTQWNHHVQGLAWHGNSMNPHRPEPPIVGIGSPSEYRCCAYHEFAGHHTYHYWEKATSRWQISFPHVITNVLSFLLLLWCSSWSYQQIEGEPAEAKHHVLLTVEPWISTIATSWETILTSYTHKSLFISGVAFVWEKGSSCSRCSIH